MKKKKKKKKKKSDADCEVMWQVCAYATPR